MPLMTKFADAVAEVDPPWEAFASRVTGRSINTVPPELTVRSVEVGVTPFVVVV